MVILKLPFANTDTVTPTRETVHNSFQPCIKQAWVAASILPTANPTDYITIECLDAESDGDLPASAEARKNQV
uniref:Uncharacterized protein n=1 Tax=Bionectria ochroleuca TaxID=29856 RepID=A0A0B7KFT7_BIOOC